MAERSTAGGRRIEPARVAGLVVAFPALLALVGIVAWPSRPVEAAAYDRFYANFAGEELIRAINADRRALGLAPFATDATLENLARERPVACPSNPSLTIRGRARDMAERNYLSHTIPGCSEPSGAAFTAFDLLKAAGYTFGAVGEDIASNDYPSVETSYATGCNLSGGACSGSITLPTSVAVAERGFMSSSLHRSNLLSTGYTRFGCGAWSSSSGNHVYSCYFASSGNGLLDATGPAISGRSGVGATFAVGARPTFTASVADSRSVLSDGWAAIDGRHIRDWAWDHAGSSSTVSATAPSLASGRHTFTWWVRDESTRATTSSFTFTIGGGGATSTPTPKATPRPTPGPTPRVQPSAGATAGPSASPSPEPSMRATAPLGGSEAPIPGSGGADATPDELVPSAATSVSASTPRAQLASVSGTRPNSSDGGGAALAAIALLLLLGVGLVPPAVVLARSRSRSGPD